MRTVRVTLGLLFFALIVGSSPTRSAAQGPPDPPQRWDGLIERLSAPRQWQAEWFSNPRMSRHAVSEDGRYVVFMADVPDPPFEPARMFVVRDRLTGDTTMTGPGPLNAPPVISSDGNHRAVELCDMYRPDGRRICDVWAIDARTWRMENMSTALDGTPSDGDSGDAMVSRDGRFIVFRTSSSTLLPPNAAPGQLVLRDRDTDQDGILDEPDASSLRVVSVSSTGETGNLESAAAEVSADGRFVAFRSRASNLVPGDTNDTWDVFLHDVESGETRRINVEWGGQQATSTIDSPAISMSADGAFIAFATDAANLTDPTHASDTNNALDVMVYDRAAGTLARVDLGLGGTLGNGHTHWPSLSADGRYVAVVSNATNVASPGTPGRYHAFVYDRATSQATRVSVNPDGTEPDRDSAFATISADGSLVTFVSPATNLPTAAPPGTDSIYAAVHFEVAPLTLTLPARGGEVTAAVTAQRYVSWVFQVEDWSWLNWGSAGAWGMGNGVATFQALRNQNPTPQTTTAVANSRTITITQEAGLHIAGFSPAQGPATGGTEVTITGTGFEPGMRAFFDGGEASSVEFVEKTSLRVVTPSHSAGDAWIYVATADWTGAAGSPTPFRFTDATPPFMYQPWLGGTQSEDGWFTSDVQIGFAFWDPDSPIISSEGCFPPALTTDTPGTSYTCSATSEGGTSTASVVVKRDATGPAIDVAAPAQTIYRAGDPALLASYTCTDALTSVADCTGMVPLQQPVDMTPGYHDFWVTARDRLGNWNGRLLTYAVTEGACAPRPDGLVAWFPFETVSGVTPTPTYAEPVHGSDGTPVNTQFVPGAAGSFAMAPAGSPSYVRTEALETFRMTTAFSLAAWVKPGEATGEFEVIAGREGEYLLGISPDGMLHWSLSTATRAWGWNRTSTQLQRGVWAHVALVYDGSQVTVYVNGITREGWSTSGPIVDVAGQFNEFRIGAREDTASPSSFSGAIDDVLLTSRALSSTELQGIALAAREGLCGPRPTLVTVSPDPVTVTYGGRVENVYTLTLTSAGSAVPDRTVYFFDPTGLLLAPARTDANGQIRFGATAWGTTVGTQRGFEARFLGDFHYYGASGENVLIVEPALPAVTWAAPASIPYGTPLGPAQLNASANVPGTFAYTPAAGTQLSVGTHPLTVQFAPADSTNYRSATATTTLTVTDPTPPVITPSAEGTLGGGGWYTSDVVVEFRVEDPESGVVGSTGCAPTTLTADTAGVTYTCSATSAGGTASASLTVKRDTIAPAISLAVPAATLYEATFPWRTNYSCTDPISGAATCEGLLPNDAPLDLTAGYHTFTVTATDRAGNTSTKEATYAVGVGQCTPRPPGFIAWWPFEEPNPGGGTVGSYRDSVSGTVDTGVNTERRFAQGPVGAFAMSTAASTSAYMSAGTRPQLRLTDALTIAAWVYPTATGELGVIAGREGEYLIARFPDGTLRYSLATTTPGWGWINTGYVLDTVWSHVALTYDGYVVRVHVNGREVLFAQTFGPIGDVAPALNEFQVGGRQDPSEPSHFTGAVDDLTLFSRALEGTEIQGMFLAGTNGRCGPVSADLLVQPSALRVTYGTTREAEISVRVSSYGTPLAGRPITVFQGDTAIASGVTDDNGEVSATATVTGVTTGTSPTAFRVDHTGDLYYASSSIYVPLITDKATPAITLTAASAIYDGLPHAATGTVTGAGGATLGPLTFTYNGSADAPVNAGTYDVVASYAGDADYTAASATAAISVTRAPLTIRAADAVKRFGAPLPPLTAAMTGFVNGDSAASLAGALALTTTATQQSTVGTYPIVPSGVSSANYAIAFVGGTLAVVRGAIDVTVTTSPEPSGFNAPLTFTASVSAAAPAAGMPTGSLRFYDGATLIGSAAVNAGTASLSTAGLDPGARTIEARYDGDTSFEPATGSASHVIRDATQTPSLALSSSRNPSNAGQSVTLTSTVSMPAGGVSGVVEFYDGAALLGASPISVGRATFTTTSLAAGSHAITARYTGANGVPPSRSDVFVQAVGASGWKNRSTSMTVLAAPNPAGLGDTLAVTADVTGSAGAVPTGRILFMVDGVAVADVAVTALSGTAARATLAVPGLAHGRHTISATYLGDPTYKGSTARITAAVN